MTITIDWQNKLVLSDADIPDIVAFKDTLREFEDDEDGMLHAPIITYKKLDIGGGGFFHGVELVNGYQLKFPAGNYVVTGNIGGTVVPVAGVYLERIKSLAYSTSSGGGGSGASAAELWAYSNRELTVQTGLTSAQDTKLTDIDNTTSDTNAKTNLNLKLNL